MNDAARENPMAAATAPAAVECPQCGTQLRMLRPATIHTPIACCICGATFYLQPVETAPLADSPIRPRQMIGAGPGMRPMFRGTNPPVRRPAERAPGDPPPAMTTPAPPPPSPGTRSAPGMPRPVELPDHLQRGFRTRWMESVLGAILVLLLVVAICAGGFVVIKAIWPTRSMAPTPTPAAEEPEPPADDPLSQPPAGDSKAQPPAGDSKPDAADLPDWLKAFLQSPTPTDKPKPDGSAPTPAFGAKPLPRPGGLLGSWESRIDDGSTSSFVFRPDGRLTLTQAGDPPPPPTEYTWYLAERKGLDLVIEVGPAFGAMNNARLTLRLTQPDAFTMVKQIRQGLVQPGTELRYIRAAGPANTPAAPAPIVGPLAPPS